MDLINFQKIVKINGHSYLINVKMSTDESKLEAYLKKFPKNNIEKMKEGYYKYINENRSDMQVLELLTINKDMETAVMKLVLFDLSYEENFKAVKDYLNTKSGKEFIKNNSHIDKKTLKQELFHTYARKFIDNLFIEED